MKVNRIPVASVKKDSSEESERSKIIYVRVYELCVIKECFTLKISFRMTLGEISEIALRAKRVARPRAMAMLG